MEGRFRQSGQACKSHALLIALDIIAAFNADWAFYEHAYTWASMF